MDIFSNAFYIRKFCSMPYVDIFAQLPDTFPLIQLSKQSSSSEQALNIWLFTVELAFKCINATRDNHFKNG